jgi:alkaline phosphatase
MKKTFVLLCAVVLALTPVASADPPQNVIVFIGDGMGPEQVKAGGMFAHGAAGTLSFESMPYQGVVTTYSANDSVTDSAAAATAIATGVKVNNTVISEATPGDGSELATMLETFAAMGKSTGLVTTTYMTHATPASFGAHEPSRYNTSQIATDYLTQTKANVLLGGGANGMSSAAALAAGYDVATDAASLAAVNTETATFLSGQFGTTHLPYEDGWASSLPHLSDMTVTALAMLDNDPDGMFLMVEGGKIDHACHNNQIDRAVAEVKEFAIAVQAALDWAAGRTDTLIIVTADHETGGLTVLSNNEQDLAPTVSWSTGGHTSTDVPVYAWGANAGLIVATMDNIDFYDIVMADYAPAPEPGAMWILLAGVGALTRRRRRA